MSLDQDNKSNLFIFSDQNKISSTTNPNKSQNSSYPPSSLYKLAGGVDRAFEIVPTQSTIPYITFNFIQKNDEFTVFEKQSKITLSHNYLGTFEMNRFQIVHNTINYYEFISYIYIDDLNILNNIIKKYEDIIKNNEIINSKNFNKNSDEFKNISLNNNILNTYITIIKKNKKIWIKLGMCKIHNNIIIDFESEGLSENSRYLFLYLSLYCINTTIHKIDFKLGFNIYSKLESNKKMINFYNNIGVKGHDIQNLVFNFYNFYEVFNKIYKNNNLNSKIQNIYYYNINAYNSRNGSRYNHLGLEIMPSNIIINFNNINDEYKKVKNKLQIELRYTNFGTFKMNRFYIDNFYNNSYTFISYVHIKTTSERYKIGMIYIENIKKNNESIKKYNQNSEEYKRIIESNKILKNYIEFILENNEVLIKLGTCKVNNNVIINFELGALSEDDSYYFLYLSLYYINRTKQIDNFEIFINQENKMINYYKKIGFKMNNQKLVINFDEFNRTFQNNYPDITKISIDTYFL